MVSEGGALTTGAPALPRPRLRTARRTTPRLLARPARDGRQAGSFGSTRAIPCRHRDGLPWSRAVIVARQGIDPGGSRASYPVEITNPVVRGRTDAAARGSRDEVPQAAVPERKPAGTRLLTAVGSTSPDTCRYLSARSRPVPANRRLGSGSLPDVLGGSPPRKPWGSPAARSLRRPDCEALLPWRCARRCP